MRREPHPISGFEYFAIGDGKVRVTNPASGETGVFQADGKHLEGAITHADLHYLIFVGGADLGPEEDVLWPYLATPALPVPPAIGHYYGRLPEGAPRAVGRYVGDQGVTTPEGPRSSGHVDADYLFDNDRKPEAVPAIFRKRSPMTGGPQKISTGCFTDPLYAKFEVERLWKRVWQMACHVDDIPNIGDTHVYRIANLSWLIVRAAENEIRAHRNICLHRGRTLRDHDTRNEREFRCPFHGWSWNIDGSLKQIPCEWDFEGVREDVASLPSARVGTWGGFVFINPDPDAMSLEDYLGHDMIAMYEYTRPETRWKQAHVTREMPANWKVVSAAFNEAYHAVATHPQLLLEGSDYAADRYDVFGHWSRGGHAWGGPNSPYRGIHVEPEVGLEMRQAAADVNREYLRQAMGDEVDGYSDAQLNDGAYCHLFPNFHPWSGWARINFRFRPHETDHSRSYMDAILTAPWPTDQPKPPAARQRVLRPDQSWAEAKELGTLGKIMDQDVANLGKVQEGLEAMDPPFIWLSQYQEGMIRNFHRNYNAYMGCDETGEL